MLVTRRHAKHMQNYEYLNWARIMHGFLHFRNGLLNLCNNSYQTRFCHSITLALGFQHFPRDLANVNEWKIMFDPSIAVFTG